MIVIVVIIAMSVKLVMFVMVVMVVMFVMVVMYVMFVMVVMSVKLVMFVMIVPCQIEMNNASLETADNIKLSQLILPQFINKSKAIQTFIPKI